MTWNKLARACSRSPVGMMLVTAAWLMSCAAENAGAPVATERDQAQGEAESLNAPSLQARAASTVPVEPMHTCGASKSPMFQSEGLLQLRIEADFTRVNTAPKEADTLTQAVVTFPDGQAAALTPDIVARGNLRFTDCAARPFSLKFQEGQSDNTPFDKLGKSVKFATHCGDKEGMAADLKAPTPEEYEQRVVMEHTVYQLLDQLGLPSLKTRLARITYHDTHTGLEDAHLAIVLEPRDKMAKRCGLVDAEDVDSPLPLADDPASVLLTHLLNAFIIQWDWGIGRRNVMTLVDVQHDQRVYAPYDFDMAAIGRPDYSKNARRTLAENGALFSEFLKYNQGAALFRQLDLIQSRTDAMYGVIQRALMDEPHRQLFSNWFNHYLPIVNQFRSCEGQIGNAERPECYVADDYGNSVETAGPLSSGEAKIQIVPPEDLDVFAVDLNPGALYTLSGRAHLEVFDRAGSVLARATPDQAVSFRAPACEIAYVQASLGQELVSVPLNGQLAGLNRTIALYSDDHGASLDSATAIRVGQSVTGRWETQHRGDDDWFALESSTPTPGLRVQVDTQSESEIWVGCIAASDQVTVENLLPGDNDVSFLFEGLVCPTSEGSSQYWLKLTGQGGDYVMSVQE